MNKICKVVIVMKKLAVTFITLFTLLFSASALAGQSLRGMEPGSSAIGQSLEEWTETYIRWFEVWLLEGADPTDLGGEKNVTFLPIVGESPFSVEVKPGTALLLPMALYIGFEGDPVLEPSDFWATVTLDGQPIAEPNEDYYVGPAPLDPPFWGVGLWFQGLSVLIEPLPAGEHTLVLDAGVLTDVFHNEWNITVVNPNKK
jgi:hypothetical protein